MIDLQAFFFYISVLFLSDFLVVKMSVCCVGGCIVQCFDICVRTVYSCFGYLLCALASVFAFMGTIYVYTNYIAPIHVVSSTNPPTSSTVASIVSSSMIGAKSVDSTTVTSLNLTSVPSDLDINCGVTYNITNRHYSSDCVFGYLLNFGNNTIYFNGKISCQCKKCTRHWSNLNAVCHDNSFPRRHGIACRFGGPRRGYNCWRNERDVEIEWTVLEEKLGILLDDPMIELPLRWRFITRVSAGDSSYVFQVAKDWDFLFIEPLLNDASMSVNLSSINTYVDGLFLLNRMILED